MVIGSLAALTGCVLMFFKMLPIYGNVVPGAVLFLNLFFCFVWKKTHRIHGTGIFTFIWLMSMVNVGCLYTSPMDPMGNECNRSSIAFREGWSFWLLMLNQEGISLKFPTCPWNIPNIPPINSLCRKFKKSFWGCFRGGKFAPNWKSRIVSSRSWFLIHPGAYQILQSSNSMRGDRWMVHASGAACVYGTFLNG